MPALHDSMSLRPQGIYSYAFLVIRVIEIAILIAIIGLAGHLIALTANAGQDPSGSLIGAVFFAVTALLWAFLSWSGYCRRYLPYAATWSVDLVLFLPFFVLAIVLGEILGDTDCDAIETSEEFSTPGFSHGGLAPCEKPFALLGLLIIICLLFAASATLVGLLHLGERRLRTSFFEATGENTLGDGGFYSPQEKARGFEPTPPAVPVIQPVPSRAYQGSRASRSSSLSRDEEKAGWTPRLRRAEFGPPNDPRES
ncbi:MARVEL domain-containing protein [Madurella fahalii]|uniref:MARVEL domain-containing protein n=1 Tax=Madurella fahalii TaxID=1157608 RepID=A0ABQ0FYP5_9PEZI